MKIEAQYFRWRQSRPPEQFLHFRHPRLDVELDERQRFREVVFVPVFQQKRLGGIKRFFGFRRNVELQLGVPHHSVEIGDEVKEAGRV